MIRSTIDYGIDLGTTNSCVSVAETYGAVVIRNNEGLPYTPSAVFVEKDGRIRTGRSAKERLFLHPADAVGRFKQWMGTEQTKTFQRSGLTMSAEQLSGEILKALREQVRQQKGEDLEAAVITVPASFDLPASEATRRAANLAGFGTSPLLQEPIAAALGYGFRQTQKSSFWLVYDLGGGTFDAAIIQVRDGEIQVVNHAGDNHLGGTDVDRNIVDKLLVPHLKAANDLQDFRRGNEKFVTAFAKLNECAEKAKIVVSSERSESIQVESLCIDDANRPVDLDFVLSRADVESVFRPFLYRSIELCRRVLSESKLSSSHIERIILVGGPTYTPYLRQILPDPKEGLGIPVDFSADPMTVVAQGAAMFAAGKRFDRDQTATLNSNSYALKLSYDPIGTDTEPLIAGTVTGKSKQAFDGFSMQFTNPTARPPWASGRIPLDRTGVFTCPLQAHAGGTNQFRIELFDPNGRPRSVTPDSLSYTIGLTIKAIPLTHNVGIAEAGNRIHVLFKKGTPLEARTTAKHVTVGLIRQGNLADILRIPLVEGEAGEAADENREIGHFTLVGSQINRDLHSGSEVEIRVKIDESRIVHAKFYIPILDYEERKSFTGLVKPAHAVSDIRAQFQAERNALTESRELAEASKSKAALNELEALNRQELVQGIDRMLHDQSTEVDLKKCEEQIVDLRRARRRIDVLLSERKMQQEAQDEMRWTEGLLDQVGTEAERSSFVELKRQVQNALSADPETLRRGIDALSNLRVELWLRTPKYWLGYRDYLASEKDKMSDGALADRWLVHADRAVASGDMEALQSACRQLRALLPRQEQAGYGGTTVRAR